MRTKEKRRNRRTEKNIYKNPSKSKTGPYRCSRSWGQVQAFGRRRTRAWWGQEGHIAMPWPPSSWRSAFPLPRRPSAPCSSAGEARARAGAGGGKVYIGIITFIHNLPCVCTLKHGRIPLLFIYLTTGLFMSVYRCVLAYVFFPSSDGSKNKKGGKTKLEGTTLDAEYWRIRHVDLNKQSWTHA